MNVLPGDDRGPYVDILNTIKRQQLPVESFLTKEQMQRVETLRRMKEKTSELHQAFGSDGAKVVSLSEHPDFQTILDKFREQDAKLPHPCYSDADLLKSLSILPPVQSIYVPELSLRKLSPEDLQHITPAPDRRLWLDLKFDQQSRPALTDMFIVSKGSLKVHCSAHELRDIMTGKTRSKWKGSDVGAVTIVQSPQGEIMTAHEAIRRGLENSEVLCVAK